PSSSTQGDRAWKGQWTFQQRMLRMTKGCFASGPTPLTWFVPCGTPAKPPRLKACRRWQWDSLSSKHTKGSVRTSTFFNPPSGCCTGKVGSKSPALTTSKRKPYSSHSQATLRVKALRLLAHQKPAPSLWSKGSTCRGRGFAPH